MAATLLIQIEIKKSIEYNTTGNLNREIQTQNHKKTHTQNSYSGQTNLPMSISSLYYRQTSVDRCRYLLFYIKSDPGCQATAADLLHVCDMNYYCIFFCLKINCEKILDLKFSCSLLWFSSAVQIICTEQAV